MENGLDGLFINTCLYLLEELTFVDIIGDLAIDDILEFVGLFQVIDHQDVINTAIIQSLNNIGADKSGTTCDYIHYFSSIANTCLISSGFAVAAPSFPTTIPAATFARCRTSSGGLPVA